jgi:hypothetical protein
MGHLEDRYKYICNASGFTVARQESTATDKKKRYGEVVNMFGNKTTRSKMSKARH